MLQRAALAATAAALSAIVAEAAPAQTPPATQPTPASRDERIERLERRLDEVEQKHQQDLRARDEEIARLKAQLDAAPQSRPSSTRPDEIEQTRRQVLEDIKRRGEPGAGASAPRPAASFNPDITLVTDFLTSYSPDRGNDAYNRLDIREVELEIRAAVHPRADGVVILAFERDVENPVFPELNGDEEEGGPESSASVEEAYLFLHDLGIPNLTAKVGRYHVRFGRQNMLHLHNLPTTDPPFVNQAFIAPETLVDSGVSLSYVIPPERIFGQYVELIGEVLAGEGGDSESPTLGGNLSVDSPAFNGHVLWNTDLTRNLNVELGGSWLTGHADADNALDVNLFGIDATLMRRDPSGGFRNTLLQAEAMYAIVDQDDGTSEEALGAYVLGQQQFNRDWYAGARLDWTQDPNDADQEAWGVTPYLTWHWTEFLRFRLSYQHRGGDRPEEDAVFFQVTWAFGAHPPHPYWAILH
jgi:hypothetical protein